MLRRRPIESASTHPWRDRVDRARDLVRRYGDPDVEVRLDEIDAALVRAADDRARLASAVADLDPDRVADELKEALRRRIDPTAPDTPVIATLRRRYESVHALQDRLADLDARIETTLVDLEAYAASVVDLSFRAGGADDRLVGHLDALNADAAALAAAHDELAGLP